MRWIDDGPHPFTLADYDKLKRRNEPVPESVFVVSFDGAPFTEGLLKMSSGVTWYILDDDHNVVAHDHYSVAVRDFNARPFDQSRRVALTYYDHNGTKDASVSTVFLHIDHGYGDGPPILFETMIFGFDDAEFDEWQWRYTTWDEAMEGHRLICAAVERWMDDGVWIDPINGDDDELADDEARIAALEASITPEQRQRVREAMDTGYID